MYFVYLVGCDDNSIYTGVTTDVERRFNEHKNGKGGRYTRSKKVIRLLYKEPHSSRSFALKREAQIKGWTRRKKLDLIQFGCPQDGFGLPQELTFNEIDNKMENSTYEAYIFCANCSLHKKIDIPKGSTINQTKCPNCGNMTLRLDPNGELFDRPPKRIDYI